MYDGHQPASMPSRSLITLEVPDPAAVRPYWLHSAFSALMGCSPKGDFTVSPLFDMGNGLCGVEVRLLNDRRCPQLEKALHDGLAAAHGGTKRLRFGRQRVGVLSGAEGLATRVAHASWNDLRASVDGTDALGLRFLSPFFVRTDNVTHPLPVAGSVVGSIYRKLKAWSMAGDTPLDPRRLRVTAFDGATVALDPADFLGRQRAGRASPWWGFHGSVTYDLAEPDRAGMRELLFLGRVAEWAGVGALTTYGLGIVEMFDQSLEPEHPEGRP